ncbi:MAG: NAD(P)-dependent oxidoreductase [Candidatus Latescibacteria bacterium]|nr:NAD(P)-dependent oxidoreductase [Candidatus Latescibacterota bacterium]
MPKALVLGSGGNIGKPLVQHLKSTGYDITECDIRPGWRDNYYVTDINQPIDLLPAFDEKPDVVIVLAAMVSRVTCEQASGLAISTNLAGINNVLQLSKRSQSKVIFFSTSEVYGPNVSAMDESLPDPQPNNRYGLSKLLGEKLIEYEVRSYGLDAVVLRPFMIYDENEDLGDHRSAMIRFASNLASGQPIEVHQGSARSWLHVSDAIRAIEAAIHVKDYAIINIGHPDVVPIVDLAEMVRSQLNAPKDLIRYKDQPSGMTPIKRPLLDRQRDILGVIPTVTLEEGVTRVCNKITERLAQRNSA